MGNKTFSKKYKGFFPFFFLNRPKVNDPTDKGGINRFHMVWRLGNFCLYEAI